MRKRKGKVREILFLEGIPKDVKSAFKAACAQRGISMRTAILDFMKRYVG